MRIVNGALKGVFKSANLFDRNYKLALYILGVAWSPQVIFRRSNALSALGALYLWHTPF